MTIRQSAPDGSTTEPAPTRRTAGNELPPRRTAANELHIGYQASAEQFGPQDLVELGVLAEQVGLDTVTVSDHFLPWRLTGGHAPSSLAWLAAVGARTERIRLGTSVLTPTFRYQPAVIAQFFATLGCLYPGRVILGVGTGEALNEVAVSAMEWPKFNTRFARLAEAVTLMRALWTEPSVSFDGDHFTTRDAVVLDRPEAPIPIYVAAGGPKVARYAGEVGDGFICTSGKGIELYRDSLLPAVAEGVAASGRPNEAVDRMIEIKLSWDPDPVQALHNTRFWAPLSLPAELKHSLHDPKEIERAADELPIEQVAQRWIVSSNPDHIVEALAAYTNLGFNHLIFHAPGADQRRFLTTFADQVLPQVRRLTPVTSS